MKRFIYTAAACFLFSTGTGLAQSVSPEPDPALLEESYLFEIVRHLYRWHLDETDVEKIVGAANVAFWVRSLTPELDPGDQSRYAQIVIPALDMNVAVKKADYTIEELGVVVKTDSYKIINVSRGNLPRNSAGFAVVQSGYEAMRDYAHRTRNQTRFPDDELLERMRDSARSKLRDHFEEHGKPFPTDPQPLHFAPISSVVNMSWVFWEGGRVLLHFASDIDLENEAVWDHDDLAVDIYDIDLQTVVSLDEVAGSNAYVTRDQVGRTLFNCIVLGRRVILEPRTSDGE